MNKYINQITHALLKVITTTIIVLARMAALAPQFLIVALFPFSGKIVDIHFKLKNTENDRIKAVITYGAMYGATMLMCILTFATGVTLYVNEAQTVITEFSIALILLGVYFGLNTHHFALAIKNNPINSIQGTR